VHEAQPLGVAVGVLAVHEAVVVLEVFVAGVVGRVDVDDVHAAFVGEGQGSEGVQVVAFDEEVVGVFGSAQTDRGVGFARTDRSFNRFDSSTLLQGTTIESVGCRGKIEGSLIAAPSFFPLLVRQPGLFCFFPFLLR